MTTGNVPRAQTILTSALSPDEIHREALVIDLHCDTLLEVAAKRGHSGTLDARLNRPSPVA
jgi:hypothetical protein